MRRRRTLLDRYLRMRSKYWRMKRLLCPSPAEVRFLRLMGARLFVIGFIKDPATGFPMSIVYRKGRVLRDAKMQRELRIGKCSVDFGNDIGWVIEVDGSAWHQDVVADFDREVYLRDYLRRQKLDLHLLRIKAPRLWNDRTAVQREVLKFLSD